MNSILLILQILQILIQTKASKKSCTFKTIISSSDHLASVKRRDAIQTSGWILKSALFGPGLIAALQGCVARVDEDQGLLVLHQDQMDFVIALADTILPSTETASASEAGVPALMDLVLQDVYAADVKDNFLEDLIRFDQDCEAATGQRLTALEAADRIAYVEEIDRTVMEQSYDDSVPFYYTFKTLCINLYFLTEQGIQQNLSYVPIPGGFQGDVTMDPNATIEVGNQM